MVKFQPLDKIDRQIAIVLFAVTLAAYLRSAAPDMLPGDPGEFQVAAWTWGLAHPTGYPLYLLVGGLWQRLWSLVGISPAASLNALSSIFGALAVMMLFLVTRRWLVGPALIGRIAALLAAVYLAVNPTFWSQNLIAEVYPLHVFFILIILFVAQGLERGVAGVEPGARRKRILSLFFLLGLSMTHHGMTLFIVPGLLVYLWLVARAWWRSPGLMLASIAVALLPLLLYLYIPLRSGPNASPWYHQPLGDTIVMLYADDWPSFVSFVTGRSISVGFNSLGETLWAIPKALLLWRLNLNLPGILLVAIGLGVLIWRKRWPVLALTGLYALLQQIFNLVYGIGDILVYYIPIYVMASIWIGFAGQLMGLGLEHDSPGLEKLGSDKDSAQDGLQAGKPDDDEAKEQTSQMTVGLIFLLLLFLLPLRTLRTYAEQLDQSESRGARVIWDAVMEAEPPENAVLISNDRNEIVPLFYLQNVEGVGSGMTGLFPLMSPEPDFSDIGAVIDMALRDGGDQPVYLIKPMPGIEAKVAIQPETSPLVRVDGLAITDSPAVVVDESLGPLTLLGYDWQEIDDSVSIALQWRVDASLDGDYTTTVQLFDAVGEKIGQHDVAPGGEFYPTSLWKPGELLLDMHEIALPGGVEPAELLVGMYTGPEFEQLAPALRRPISIE